MTTSAPDRKLIALQAAASLLGHNPPLDAVAKAVAGKKFADLAIDELPAALDELAKLTLHLRDALLQEPYTPYTGRITAPRR